MEASKTTLANRISLLRNKSGLSQSEFAKALSNFRPMYSKDTGAIRPAYATMTISNWETGRKVPPMDMCITLAQYFGVSLDYLLGFTDQEELNNVTKRNSMLFPETQIKYSELSDYDKSPIYLVFSDGSQENQWGIVDDQNRQIICISGTIPYSREISYFTNAIHLTKNEYTINNNGSKFAMNYTEMLRAKTIYIEPVDVTDSTLAALITGWYEHKEIEGHGFLKNKANGYTLPYHGLGISFNAYGYR